MTRSEVQRFGSARCLAIRLSTLLLLVGTIAMIQGCSTTSGTLGSMPTSPVSKESAFKAPAVYVGNASWYGPGFSGKTTASGDIFDESKMTAAHKTLPLGTQAKVTNLKDGTSVQVVINDRGPYTEGRIIDLSQAAARALGIIDRGVVKVRVESLENSIASGDTK